MVAGSTVVVSILGQYISGMPFVGAMGLASAIVVAVTMLTTLTLVPTFLGTAKSNVRSLGARWRARKAGLSAREEAELTAATTHEHHKQGGFARWGRRVSRQPWVWGIASVVVLVVLAIPLFSLRLGQLDAGTNPTTDSSRRAYDLISEGFDFTERIASRMIWLIIVVVAIAFVLLTIAFRSVIIPVKASVLNLLSVGAAYGVIVAVFEWGWGSSAFGIQEKLPIPAYVPMMVFAIVFGLSMDYEVFLLSRVHESWLVLRDALRAVAVGIGATARVITTAAAIMVVVFASFLLDPDPSVKMLALGMAVAVLIDATIVRMMLVPSVMSFLGERAWWMPAWLDRITPKIQLEGGEPAEPEPEPAGPLR